MNKDFEFRKCFVLNFRLLPLFFILLGINSAAQSWKNYPYQEQGSKIEFPYDEGFHPDESLEWWYANGHLTGQLTGHRYSYILSYFHRPVSVYDGFRILKITNETTHESFSQILPCIYPVLSTDSLHIVASFLTGEPEEEWVNRSDIYGSVMPFQYLINAYADSASIHLNLDAQRCPMLIDGDGFLYQGSGNYTYYYSLTNLATQGSIIFGEVEETVTGISWFDRQYGNFNPYEDESYEWFCIQLEGNADLNIWNIFTQENSIPDTREYRICSVIINDTVSFTTSDFIIERLSYAFTPDSQRCYATSWKVFSDTMGLDILIKVNNENDEIILSKDALRFYEGSININGNLNNETVKGSGFAELLHSYENPVLEIKQPDTVELWDHHNPLIWEISNHDDGNPMKFDIEIEYQSGLSKKVACGLNNNMFYWNPSVFSDDSVFNITVTAYSKDTTLSGTVRGTFFFGPENTDIFVCEGENFSTDLNLDNEYLFYKWLYNGQTSTFPETSALAINPVTIESAGVYECVVYNDSFRDTTMEFHLNVGFCDQISENQQEKIILFPNPLENHIIIRLPLKTDIYLIRITDTQGSLIEEFLTDGGFESTIYPDLAPGNYFLTVVSASRDTIWSFVISKM